MATRDESIRSFCAATGAPPHAAPQYLESASWDVATAIQMYRANVEMNGNSNNIFILSDYLRS